MKLKRLKARYIFVMFLLLLAGLAGTAHAIVSLSPTSGTTLTAGYVGTSYTSAAICGLNPMGTCGCAGTCTWTLISALPSGSGLNLSTTSGSTTYITGTPLAVGTYTFTLQLYDSGAGGTTLTGTYYITINSPLTPLVLMPVTGTTILPNAVRNMPYFSATTLTASGGTPSYTWSIQGNNRGFSLTTSGTDNNTCTLSGSPTAGAGTYTLRIRVRDSNGTTVTNNYTITIIATGCSADSNGVIDFGTLDGVTNSGINNATVTTAPTIYCSTGNTYAVTASGANGGTNTGAGYNLKNVSGSELIAYSFSYTTPITGRGSATSIGGSTRTTDLNMSASMAAGVLDNVPASTYTDTITLTITF